MAKFRKMPVEVEAVQFTGDNWAEMHEFTGHAIDTEGHSFTKGASFDIFVGEGKNDEGRLYVADSNSWELVDVGRWIIKDGDGFHSTRDDIFQKIYISDEEFKEFSGLTDYSRVVGDIPELDQTADDYRMMGRIRMALIMTRPMAETDAISERMSHIMGWYRVAYEEGYLDKIDAAKKNIVGEPTEPGFYYNHGSAQVLIYLLKVTEPFQDIIEGERQWYVLVDNATLDKCEWGYIEQSTGAYPLRRLGD